MRWSHAVVGARGGDSLSTEGILGDLSGTPEEEDVTDDGVVVADPLCDVSPPRGAEGVRRGGGAEHTALRRGAAEVVWGEGGSSGGGGIETGVGIPAKLGADGEGMERCRRDMERQVTMGNRERIVIGGFQR